MKTPIPVTLDDLEETAKQEKDGLATYKKVEVIWRINGFSYFYGNTEISKAEAAKFLLDYQK